MIESAMSNALNLHTSSCLMLPSDQFSGIFDISSDVRSIIDNCHIYIIGTRPRVFFNSRSVIHFGDVITGRLKWREAGEEKECSFRLRARAPYGERFVLDQYPHRKLISAKGFVNGKKFIPIMAVVHEGEGVDPVLRDYEVLYVGQSYASGKRNAFDRLRRHETLQRILADHAENRPDDELMIFMFQYEEPLLMTTFSPQYSPQAEVENSALKFASLVMDTYSREEIVNVAEAGLIRYFQPEYNNHYVDRFPENRQEILRKCYQRDLDALTVEVNTEELNARLRIAKSGEVGSHHIAKYDLHDDSKRRSFFLMSFKDGETVDFREPSGALF